MSHVDECSVDYSESWMEPPLIINRNRDRSDEIDYWHNETTVRVGSEVKLDRSRIRQRIEGIFKVWFLLLHREPALSFPIYYNALNCQWHMYFDSSSISMSSREETNMACMLLIS
jgi:hypothetical protein